MSTTEQEMSEDTTTVVIEQQLQHETEETGSHEQLGVDVSSSVKVSETGQGTVKLPLTGEGNIEQLPKFDLPQLVLEADKNKWSLPQ